MTKVKTRAARRECTIGCDVADRKSEVFILLSGGKSERAVVATRRAAWETFFERPRAHVVLEAGTHSGWISRLAAAAGHRVTVANLARLGRADPRLLAPIEHRQPRQHADLAVAKTRDVLVRVRTSSSTTCVAR